MHLCYYYHAAIRNALLNREVGSSSLQRTRAPSALLASNANAPWKAAFSTTHFRRVESMPNRCDPFLIPMHRCCSRFTAPECVAKCHEL